MSFVLVVQFAEATGAAMFGRRGPALVNSEAPHGYSFAKSLSCALDPLAVDTIRPRLHPNEWRRLHKTGTLQEGGSPIGASRTPAADWLARFRPYVEDAKGSCGGGGRPPSDNRTELRHSSASSAERGDTMAREWPADGAGRGSSQKMSVKP